MKKIFFLAIAIFAASTASISAFDLKGALKGLGSGNNSAGDLVNALGNVLSTDKIELKSIVGQWNYSAPAITFKSDNLLKKAGGAAASTVVTNKLAPIYKTVGLDKMTLNIEESGAFQLKVRGITLKGTIEAVSDESTQANFIFNFQAASKNIGKVNAYVEKSVTGTMKLTFDVSKLIAIIEKLASATNNSTINTLSKTLSSYDGLCAGFELKK